MSSFRIVTAGYDHPDAVKLIAEVQQEYLRRYGSRDETPVDAAEFAPPLGIFLLGYLADEPVACGGWRGSGEHRAELKRMYVVPSARGRGFARTVLAELEATACGAGHTHMILETGLAQPEAIGLYTSSGYRKIEKFGRYACEPDSRAYGKRLSGAARRAQERSIGDLRAG